MTNKNIASQASLSMAMASPVRTRLVADLIRGKSIDVASRTLLLEKVKPAAILMKLLKSAVSNAEQKGVADLSRLFISDLQINEGPRIKRFMPRAQGRADGRWKRTSHIQMKLSEKAVNTAKKTTAKKATSKAASGDK